MNVGPVGYVARHVLLLLRARRVPAFSADLGAGDRGPVAAVPPVTRPARRRLFTTPFLRGHRARYALATAAPRPADGFHSSWTMVDGVRMHARVATQQGRRASVVLVHGLAVSHRYLMPTAQLLAAHHDVYVVDLPGFGLSGDPGPALDVPEHAAALADGWMPTGSARRYSWATRSAVRFWWNWSPGSRSAAPPWCCPGRPSTRTPVPQPGRSPAGCVTSCTRTRCRSRSWPVTSSTRDRPGCGRRCGPRSGTRSRPSCHE